MSKTIPFQRAARTAAIAGMLLALAGCGHQAPAGDAQADIAASNDPALILKGEYLARAGDCMACHSVAGKAPYAGGLAIQAGMGTIYSSNITPDKEHGIGAYSQAQFADAVRKGMRADGAHLYPAMPYPDYAKVSDADIHALYAYFMHGVKPSSETPPQTDLHFPFSQRWGMALWNGVFTDDKTFAAPPGANAEVSRGAYLVEGLGHCSSCHTPRGIAMQEKALDSSDKDFLAGGELNGWRVPPLRGMGHWSISEITDYLAGGRNSTAAVAGEMTAVVANSTAHLTDADRQAIAAYLKSLPGAPAAPRTAKPQTEARLTAARNLSEGERLYLDNCAACHMVSGQGAPRVFPRLDGASVVDADNPTALVHVILAGAQTPSTAAAPSVLPMPGFASRLSDQDVAELASFVRGGWSNHAEAVSDKQVAKVRATLEAHGE